jgi:hypothetical protein
MWVSSGADADASSGSHGECWGEVWNLDRSRPRSNRSITLLVEQSRTCLAVARPQECHITDPSPCTFLPLEPKSLLCSCGRGGVTLLSSLPPLPPLLCAPEGAQVGFEPLTATKAIGSLKLKRAHRGALRRCRQIARSLSPSAAAPLAPLAGSQLAVVPSNRRRCHKTGQSRALHVESQADRAVAWTSRFHHWSCRTFSWPAGLNGILVAGIAACWNPQPAHGSPFERAAGVWSICNWPRDIHEGAFDR